MWRNPTLRGLGFSISALNIMGGITTIALPLIVVTVTGIHISFPQTSRAVLGSVMTLAPQQPRTPFARALEHPAQRADSVVAAVLEQVPGGQLAILSLPHEKRLEWSVQIRAAGSGETVQFSVEDATGRIRRLDAAGPGGGGDAVSRLIRQIHDGQGTGLVWETLVFLTGILPAAFVVTGVMMWLRRRGNRRKLELRREAVRSSSALV